MAFPAPTKTFHTTPYPSISPTRPELSQKGRRIVITGGGYGIGRSLALAFAGAGAAEVAILGRKLEPLRETAALVAAASPGTKVTPFSADVTDAAALHAAASEFGAWDVLFLNAGYLPDNAPVRSMDVAEWWRGFEVNVLGTGATLRAFLPFKGADRPVVVGTSTGGVLFPKAMATGSSGYLVSKMAVASLMEYVAAEEPDVHVVTIHPGVIATAMYDKFANPDLVPDDREFPVSRRHFGAVANILQLFFRHTLACGLRVPRLRFCVASLCGLIGTSMN
jgi:NAD(P)-dependent dehydrogenase (short-subunit alcohol dehydrogenase family)